MKLNKQGVEDLHECLTEIRNIQRRIEDVKSEIPVLEEALKEDHKMRNAFFITPPKLGVSFNHVNSLKLANFAEKLLHKELAEQKLILKKNFDIEYDSEGEKEDPIN